MKHLFLLAFLCGCGSAFSQHTLSLRMHDQVLQSYRFYPQNQTHDTAWTIGLPSGAVYIGNTGFRYNDIVASEGDSAYLTFENMISKLKKNNFLSAYASIPFLTVSRRWGKWQLALHQAEVLSIDVRYTKDMAEFLWYGNSKFIGRNINLAPDAEMLRYYETALNVSRSINKWNVGATIKYFEGVSCISIQGNDLNIYTEPGTYNITVDTDIEIHRSNTKEIAQIGAFPKVLFKNPGLGLDLGVSRQLKDDFHFNVSATNFGLIRWRTDIQTLKSQNQFQFNGVDLSGFVLGDSLDVSIYEDSVMQLLKFKKSQGSFTSYTVPAIQAGLDYQLSENYNLGAFAQVRLLSGGREFTMAISAMRHFKWRWHELNLGGHYAYRNRNPINFGISVDYRWRFIQIFAMSDNLIAWFLPKARVPISLFDSKSDVSVVIPKHLKSINFHFGVNLILSK